MKKILSVLFTLLTFVSVYAGSSKRETKHKKDTDINIQIDKKGDVHINGILIDDKAVEEWVNKYLKNLTIEIDDSTGQKAQKVELSLKIKEK